MYVNCGFFVDCGFLKCKFLQAICLSFMHIEDSDDNLALYFVAAETSGVGH